MSAPFRRGLYAIVDLDALGIRDPLPFAAAVLEGGAVALQLRAKTAPAAEVLAVARTLAAACRARAVPFFVNDRADIAIAAGADGVHVGQDDLPVDEVRRQTRGSSVRWVGLSTHDRAQVGAAVAAGGMDYVGFGPIFETRRKPDARPTVGLGGIVDAVAAAAGVPIVAIGGIGPGSAREIAGLGAHAVAVIDALARTEDPAEVARQLQGAFA